jgi:hypothetical protein
MINVRSSANSATTSVNPNILVTINVSTGYTIGAGRKQIPTYAPPVTGYAQLQALDGKDLKQLDGLNIEGTIRALYCRGQLAGVIRPDTKGGDTVEIDGKVWLVIKVLESWPTWTKVAIVLQME